MKKINLFIGRFFIVISAYLPFQQAYPQHSVYDDTSMAQEILMYINQYRASHGLPKLIMDPRLSREATLHSREMATHAQPFGHQGFQGRIARLHQHVPESTSGAENVAYNYKTAKIVADGWIHSPGHRQNIVGHYNLTGIGIVRDAQGRPYFTQMFLRTDNPVTSHRSTHAHPLFAQHRFYHGHG